MWQAILKAALAIGLYFSPVQEIFVLMIGFVAVDLVTGLIASRNRRIPRSSRRLRKSVLKVLCYIAAVLLAFWAEQVLQIEWFASHRFIAGLICVVEFISVLENLAVISGHPVFLKIIKLIRGKASQDNVINEIINEKNDPAFVSGTLSSGELPDDPAEPECGDSRCRQCPDCRNPPGYGGDDRGRQQPDPGADRVRQRGPGDD